MRMARVSLAELAMHDGQRQPSIWLALQVPQVTIGGSVRDNAGQVVIFDVSSGSAFYGPGKSYSIYAGNDCTTSLIKMNIKDKSLLNTTPVIAPRPHAPALRTLHSLFLSSSSSSPLSLPLSDWPEERWTAEVECMVR